MKLFNAIQQTQSAAAVVQEEAKASRGTGKPSLPAPAVAPKGKGKKAAAQTSSLGKSSAGKDLSPHFLHELIVYLQH